MGTCIAIKRECKDTHEIQTHQAQKISSFCLHNVYNMKKKILATPAQQACVALRYRALRARITRKVLERYLLDLYSPSIILPHICYYRAEYSKPSTKVDLLLPLLILTPIHSSPLTTIHPFIHSSFISIHFHTSIFIPPFISIISSFKHHIFILFNIGTFQMVSNIPRILHSTIRPPTSHDILVSSDNTQLDLSSSSSQLSDTLSNLPRTTSSQSRHTSLHHQPPPLISNQTVSHQHPHLRSTSPKLSPVNKKK